jgi:preprotein translocase subunit SecG
MHFLYYVIVTLHVVACLFLIGVVLLQQGRSQDLASAFGGGGTQTAFGPRGSANVLSRATTVLAGLFMITSLSLTVLRPKEGAILERLPATAPSPSPVAAVPSPVVPPASIALPVTEASAAPAAPTSTAPAATTPASPAAPAASPAGR